MLSFLLAALLFLTQQWSLLWEEELWSILGCSVAIGADLKPGSGTGNSGFVMPGTAFIPDAASITRRGTTFAAFCPFFGGEAGPGRIYVCDGTQRNSDGLSSTKGHFYFYFHFQNQNDELKVEDRIQKRQTSCTQNHLPCKSAITWSVFINSLSGQAWHWGWWCCCAKYADKLIQLQNPGAWLHTKCWCGSSTENKYNYWGKMQ